ncbi:chromosome segregation protein SMC [Amnibacterium setariae]|uniref:Chromosome partition protein Smc n=1 Tax=Amnibacterium setariae TaxID=2306585 RepID=A0A3A1TVX0_9MICO|nr:chromosome segregation protein SMC [Amnibacterium setariae]RIX28382.1 chromosome segregation protein SMC [Amnibacterium setariae]
MHLKSLTLKGFKSFAQPTTFVFEPGVTCIVGPNGSGKSNVVDALAWVMGEQGAKNLRGGSMADVIFAGTATRGPLGRAEVVLTIDNADGALPIEYSEVAISRTLFRDGRSEYAINGDSVRLLDVQELLSDSGLGREMHVIVGQGQLDAVLRATPEERRGFIEEAAGILKHRRRRERTLRKLDSMQANLTRLTDLKDELQRQLKPLGAQAEIAREAGDIQAAVRDARTRLLAHDAARLAASVAALTAEQEELATARDVAADGEQRLEARAAVLEREAADDGLDGLRRTAIDLEGVQQRFRVLAQSAATRVALLAPEEAPAAAAGPSSVERADAVALVASLEARVGAVQSAAEAAQVDLAAAQAALDEVDRRIAADAARVAEHDRAVAALERDAAAAGSRAAAADAEGERRAGALAAARTRAEAAAAALAELPEPTAEGPTGDDAAVHEALVAASAEVDAARSALHALEREQSAVDARLAALTAATAAPPSVAQVLGALPGARRLQDLVDIDPAWRTAVGAVLGPLLDAAVVDDPAASAPAVAPLGAVDLVAAAAVAPEQRPTAGTPAIDVVRAPSGVLALLRGVVLVLDLPAARAAVEGTELVAATAAGELVTAARLRTAGAGASGLELTADRDAAAAAAEDLAGRVADARDRLRTARSAQQTARAASEAAQRRERERTDAARSEERRRAALVAAADAATAEVTRATAQAAEAAARRQDALAARDAASAALETARAAERPVVDGGARVPLAAAVDAAREAAVAARLEGRTLQERLNAERARVRSLDERARAAEAAAERAARRAAERALQREAAEAVLTEVPAWQASVDASLVDARSRLALAERERAAMSAELREARARLAAARTDVGELDRRARDLDMRLYEQQVSLQSVRDKGMADLGLDADALAAAAIDGLDRQEEERRLATAERRLARLGRVNPLALEEFAALEQRHAHLGEQLADLHRTRADLLKIVEDLDRRMHDIFSAAYADTEAAFERIFPVLFPGGSGRLSLTEGGEEPGIDVAVRPAGKKIERLSLLSGGERSLAAVAFLLAIFTARPSPFYILDEVEAALDDANLGRLLEVISSLRDASQLILITHQKRTMEIADALYGVSMRQDGVSNVIGQRLAARS